MNDEVRHFSLRKLSIGLASVLVGVSIFGTSQTVKADTVADQNTSSVTNNAQSSDTQENKNVAKSSFSNDNQANNAKSNTTQTQENEQKQVQTENVQQDSVSKTQEATDSNELQEKSAEKDIARRSSLQKTDNQSNDHAEDNSQTQPQNSKKFAKKVLATNLSETASSTTTNGGFDEATWGKLDVNDWQGSVQDGVYQLTGYTGDKIHIIVPNEADFEKAGRSTNGLQVGITRDTVQSLLLGNNQVQTIAFSKTNNQKIKAIGTDWSQVFAFASNLSKLDGSNLDVSNVTNMREMFEYDKVSDLTSLAHWNVSNVTNMSKMFYGDYISNLTPLADWDTSNVTDMSAMFEYNKVSDLTPLAHWDIGKVTDMSEMFRGNSISDLTPLAHWDTSNVTDMSEMFALNSISDLTSLASWKTDKVTNMSGMFDTNRISDLSPLTSWNTDKVTAMIRMFDDNQISDLTPLTHWNVSNVVVMSGMFEGNQISNLSPLASWDTSNVTDMRSMFDTNRISDLSPLTSWNTGKVTSMSYMFASNPDLINLRPIANWNMSIVNDWDLSRLFSGDTKLDLTNINNTPLMQSFLKNPIMLQGATFIINNVDFVTLLVKGTTGKDAPILTNTAKRTIVFNFPDGTSKTIVQTINYRAVAPVQVNWPAPPKSSGPNIASIDIDAIVLASLEPPASSDSNSYFPQIVKTYPVKESDWQLDTSKQNDDVIIDGVICFKPVKIPHVNGYKAYIVPDKPNSASFTVSFMAVPTENKPSTPAEETPSKPSAPTDHPNNSVWTDLKHKVVNTLNQSDSGWTMPENNSTYTVEVPDDAIIDLSDLVIAEPVHAQTRVKLAVTKHFKLSKKHSIKHLKHRKKAVKSFKKYRL